MDNLPNNYDETLDSSLNLDNRRILEFLDFCPDKYYKLQNLSIKDEKTGLIFNSEEEFKGLNIFILKDVADPSGSESAIFRSNIKVNVEPNCLAGILTIFHEVGHKKSNVDLIETYLLGSNDRKEKFSKEILVLERDAWAYALQKLKPFLKGMDVTDEDLKRFIHEWALGSYSEFLENYLSK